jgi:hypothetical protein
MRGVTGSPYNTLIISPSVRVSTTGPIEKLTWIRGLLLFQLMIVIPREEKWIFMGNGELNRFEGESLEVVESIVQGDRRRGNQR